MAAGAPLDVGQVLAEQLVKAAKVVEEQLDAELNKYFVFINVSLSSYINAFFLWRYDHMDENDFEALKQKRLAALKHQQAKKQEWLANGHGR